MTDATEIRKAREVVAELAEANPALRPVFDRLDREYQTAKQEREAPEIATARRARDRRELI